MKILVFIVTAVIVVLGITQLNTRQSDSPENTISDQKKDTAETSSESARVEQSDGAIIDLSGKGLTTVPATVFTQTRTTELDLSNNRLTGALEAEVRHLQNLEILDLSDNQFTGVPAEIGQLRSLKTLDLSNNKLTGLPHELGNLSNLTQLDLRGNEYSETDLAVIKKSLPATTKVIVD